MILKRLLLNQAPVDGGMTTPAAPAAPAVATPTPAPATAPAAKKNIVQAPRKPSAEELKVNFELDATDDGMFDDETAPADKAAAAVVAPVAPKVEEPAKVEPVKVEPPVAQPVKPEAAPAAPKPDLLGKLPKKDQGGQRDLTGFGDVEQRILKSMSNEAYEYVAPLLRKKSEIEQSKHTQFFQHPDGYMLHPEFRRVQSEAAYATQEGNAWREQLLKIKAGEEWTPLVGVDPKTGNFVYGSKRAPTPQDEEMVRVSMQKCMTASQNAQQQLQVMPQQFQEIVTRDLQSIQATRSQKFDWVADPNLLKAEIEVNGAKKTVEAIRGDFISLFPPYMRSSPATDVAADLFVAVQIFAERLKAAEAGKVAAETIKNEVKRVEPTATERPAKAAANKYGVTDFDLAGLPE